MPMNVAILLAAGSSLRLKDNVTPKQFLTIKRKKLYQYSLETFLSHRSIQAIILVVQDDYVARVSDEVKRLKSKKQIIIVSGGRTRQESSYAALQYAYFHLKPDYVVIHDVARPLITTSLIEKVLLEVKKKQAVTLGREVNDSLFVKTDTETLESYVSKNKIYLVQTPQAFAFNVIFHAHEHARSLNIKTAMDDASLLRLQNKDVFVIPGSRHNFKIVTTDDLSLFKKLI
jgi:2-C-methyl-D-erythritol 4-phosphate cytidylyltransferase